MLFLSVKPLYILFVQRKSFSILDKLGKILERILGLIRRRMGFVKTSTIHFIIEQVYQNNIKAGGVDSPH